MLKEKPQPTGEGSKKEGQINSWFLRWQCCGEVFLFFFNALAMATSGTLEKKIYIYIYNNFCFSLGIRL